MSDIEGFAALTDSLGAHRTIEFLNAYFEVVVEIVERYRGVVTQFQGDAILAVFNVPIADRDHGANALRAALEIVHAAAGAELRRRSRAQPRRPEHRTGRRRRGRLVGAAHLHRAR